MARAALTLLGLAVVLGAIRFWMHDALPYLMDYSEDTYNRYWPHRLWLIPHIIGGSVALLAGPFILWLGISGRVRKLHRRLGYAYILGIAVSALSCFGLAPHSRPAFGLSLAVLSIVWLVTVSMALIAARNKRFDAHREWMVRSYIVTFSFASYRLLVKLSVFSVLGESRSAVVLWISWVAPMMFYEVLSQWDRVKPRRQPRASAVSSETS